MSDVKREACAMSKRGSTVCKAGFFQKPLCHGLNAACVTCGAYGPHSTPDCMKDDLPDRRMPLHHLKAQGAYP